MNVKTNLELEAKEYRQKKKKPLPKIKPLTSRRYLAGQALAGILASGQGAGRMSEVKREAYDWADYMLEDDD